MLTLIIVVILICYVLKRFQRCKKFFRTLLFLLGAVWICLFILDVIGITEVSEELVKETEILQQEKKDLLEMYSLDEETFYQLIERYNELENEIQSNEEKLATQRGFIEDGGREKIGFWLFFNLK